ncbi:MAG: response regulator [Bacteroidota bacterium]
MKTPIKLFIADDHQMFIDGIKALLQKIDHIQIVGEANTGGQVLEKLKNVDADMILLDIRMPELSGIEAANTISENYPKIKMIAVTMFDDNNNIAKMLKAGVKGYILKNTSKDELLKAIETVAAGNTFYSEQITANAMRKASDKNAEPILRLTKREIEVIKLIARSLTNKEIAKQLFLSELTIKTHRQNAMQKLGLKNTAGLVKFAMDNNLIGY